MRAIILAAGVGSRLQALSGGKPKCLVEIGGRPLILHQIEALADHGIGPVLVVAGYKAEEVKSVVGDRAEFIVNDRYQETNSLYSLWLARDQSDGPFILLNCDLFFSPEILERLLDAPANSLAYDSTSSRGREQTKIAVKEGRVVDIGKDVPAGSARGESLGTLKFDAEGGKAMFEAADRLIREGNERAWVIEATRAASTQVPIHAVNVAGLPWTEIDFPYDLDVARREVWPTIYKSRWRKQVYWRRTRWLLLAALAVAIATGGWAANARVGPASIDWETMPLVGGTTTTLDRKGKPQSWWVLAPGETAVGHVSGAMAGVELRLVLDGQPSAAGYRYAIAISLDGKPHDWRAFSSGADTTVVWSSGPVGDRDRIDIPLAAGTHEIGVTLLGGHGSRILVRIRQSDIREE
jgi:choline kinase